MDVRDDSRPDLIGNRGNITEVDYKHDKVGHLGPLSCLPKGMSTKEQAWLVAIPNPKAHLNQSQDQGDVFIFYFLALYLFSSRFLTQEFANMLDWLLLSPLFSRQKYSSALFH